jgi:hypothetical protein
MRLLVVFFFLLIVTMSATAQVRYLDPVPDDGCGEVDPNQPCYAFSMGAKFTECKALGSYLEKCYECAINRFGRKVCVGVFHTASCYCEQDGKNNLGETVPCYASGTCTYSEF